MPIVRGNGRATGSGAGFPEVPDVIAAAGRYRRAAGADYSPGVREKPRQAMSGALIW